MPSTTYVDFSQPAVGATWLNEVNDYVFDGVSSTPSGGKRDAINEVLKRIGYNPFVDYGVGLLMSSVDQTVLYNGVPYYPKLADLPFTTSGSFEAAKFAEVFGVSKYQFDLLRVADYAALRIALDASSATMFSVTGYLGSAAPTGIAGTFVRGEGASPGDNGGTIIQSAGGEWAQRVGEFPNVGHFGAKPGTACTTELQLAINSGLSLIFPEGTYDAHGLTQSADNQKFYAQGAVNIRKDANGVLLASTGDYVEFHGIQFDGTGYTGNNVESTGVRPLFSGGASYGTPGRALKATGTGVRILGTSSNYTTTDVTASGYDIELGISGTATLYHRIIGITTGQATGGILLTDTGSAVIDDSTFGKLTIVNGGTTPAGSNGGNITASRILGDVSVDLSNAVFSGNTFSTQTITFEAGTSNHSLDASNNTSSATIVNNGNANSVIVKSVGTGAPAGLILQYGRDASNVTMRYSNTELYIGATSVTLPNAAALRVANAAGTALNAVTLSAADDWSFGSDNAAGNFTNIVASTGGVYLVVDAASRFRASAAAFLPATDNTYTLGSTSLRYSYGHFTYVRTHALTVGTLTAAATVGAGARAFVTDANATTFASVVAGGGANGVPVYSDGTDWRIG